MSDQPPSTFLEWMPTINASLNAIAAILLFVGYVQIRNKNVKAHRNVMLSAFGVSVIFLVSYITYHWQRQMQQGVGHTKWEVPGVIQWVYYLILLSHVILAAFVPFIAIATIALAMRGDFARHRRLARITWPVWMYVSITGVIVYLMLYHLHPMLMHQ